MQSDQYTTRQRNEDSLSLYQERELTVHDLLQMFRRRRTIVFITTGVVFALAVVFCALILTA
jgi:uncharacterized protein involved in exopolysaccharide biosynthesis